MSYSSIAEKYKNRLLNLKRGYVEELRREVKPDIRADVYVDGYGLCEGVYLYSLEGLAPELLDTYAANVFIGGGTKYVEIRHRAADGEYVWGDKAGRKVENVRLVYSW